MNFAKKPSVSDNALIPAVRTTPVPPAHVAVTTYRPAFLYRSTTVAPSHGSYPQPNVNNVFIKHHGDPLLSGPAYGGNSIDDNYLQPSYDVTSRYIPPNELNNALASSSERYHIPSKVFEPPLSADLRQHGIKPIAVVSSTPAPISITSHNVASVSPIGQPSYSTTPRPTTRSYYPSTTARPLPVDNYVAPLERPYTANPGSYYSKDYANYPLNYYGKAAAKGYRPYDGVSLTNDDGFKYYLPRQYHEEQGSNDVRDGSFGYIDPFGIRRVIYYNVRPGSGFRHRKNNRYVGFDATPYDPRPAHK